jgi:acyl-CoA synthetase (AMP-forming)/AMP-acid ligase II
VAHLRVRPAGGIAETVDFLQQCIADGDVAGIAEPGQHPPIAPVPDDAVLALWTSGSTGEPKGVLFGEDRLALAARTIAEYLDLRGRIGVALPLHYSYALVGQVLAGQAAGATLVDLRGRQLHQALVDERIDVFSGVPSLLRQLVEAVEDGAPPPALQTLCSAGAPLSCSLARRLRAIFPDATLWNQYGTTELGPRLAAIPHHDPAFTAALADGRPPPAGRLLPGAEARLVDGVLEARTPWQALGTLDRIEPDAWHSTGDLATLDGDLVHIHGRADHVLLVGGEKVHPAGIERVLEALNVTAVVVGRAHRRLGQVPVAFLVGDPSSESALWENIRVELAPRARPASLTWLDAFPRLASGKVDRAALIDRLDP